MRLLVYTCLSIFMGSCRYQEINRQAEKCELVHVLTILLTDILFSAWHVITRMGHNKIYNIKTLRDIKPDV